MSCFLTQSRAALVDAIQHDGYLRETVRRWWTFDPGLQKRISFEPTECPFCIVAPTSGAVEWPANAYRDIVQAIEVTLGTDGQDVAPLEELAARVIDVIRAEKTDLLGLAGDGLANIDITSIAWTPRPDEQGARILWTAVIAVRLLWKLL